MGLFGTSSKAFAKGSDLQHIAAHYKRLCQVRFRVNEQLSARVSPAIIEEVGKRLGLLRKGVFVFNDGAETSLLMDYCIRDVYRQGRNAVDAYLCDSPPAPDSIEFEYLQALQHAEYTIVVVLEICRGVGCLVRNMFTGETRMLADVGFSQTAEPGVLLGTRLCDFGEFVTTTGAPVPLGWLEEEDLEQWQDMFLSIKAAAREDPAPLIRHFLHREESLTIHYAEPFPASRLQREFDPDSAVAAREEGLERRRQLQAKPAGNRRCRCGSGKMFKNCCGKKRANAR